MLHNYKSRLGLALLALALTWSTASAQNRSFVFFPPPILNLSPSWGGFGGVGYPGYGGGYGGYPGIGTGGYGMGGFPNYTGSSGYGYPGFYNSGFASTIITVPGWIAGNDGTSVNMRSAYTPAVALAADSPLLQVSTPAATGTRAQITVTVPNSGAKVWIDGTLTSQTGLTRNFITPELRTGKDFVYDIRVQWLDESGQLRSQERTVSFRAGSDITVAFTR
jgi:uncharacterized protein (TIGR03000 family)